MSTAVLALLRDRVLALPGPRSLVAVSGPDAAGKTTLCDALAAALGVPVVRASVDGFHFPRAQRVRQGALSAEGYLADALDLDALERELLQPFAGGAAQVAVQVHDLAAGAPAVQRLPVPERAVLLLDGVLLLQRRLRSRWDLAVWLHVAPEESLRRGVARDGEQARERYLRRYLPAQELHRERERPHETADVVLDATDPAALRLLAG